MIESISKELNKSVAAVRGCVQLLEEGASIPFIARYRKEFTHGLDELDIASINDALVSYKELEKRKQYVLESIAKQAKLTTELKQKIISAKVLAEVEDIYLPFKPKRKTRASVARERGLEPLAKMIMGQNSPEFYFKAEQYTRHKEIDNAEEAIDGAIDIMAEWISERQYIRKSMRKLWQRKAMIKAKKNNKGEDKEHKYSAYYKWEEAGYRAPSHRLLALFRGEKEGVLKLKIIPDEQEALTLIEQSIIKSESASAEEVRRAIKESYKRLLLPAMETEYRKYLKEKADEKAIAIFAQNLRQLLMTSPMGQKITMAIDPGFKSGCKIVVLDAQGKLLHNETIYPHPPQRDVKTAKKKLIHLVDMYHVEAIAIGNGTAGRETEIMVHSIHFNRKLVAVMVNENGASVYSASALAREEFPNYDITVRGAVSIGRRMMDPLAELLKIEPKAIGVGQYQHDVDQKKLQRKLEEVVASVVNNVGVELNTASKELLQYIAGIGRNQAKKIIEYREANGPFESREQLLKVSGFGEKAYEQAAGFIRIAGFKNPLDNTAVHPESYFVVRKIAKANGLSVEELLLATEKIASIKAEDYIGDQVGIFTINDILQELQKPSRDPRKKMEAFEFDKKVKIPADLVVGMKLPGIITNITAFGAFVDVGVHQDGLVHISKLKQGFVSNPHEVVSLSQKVEVTVLSVDLEKKRIQFSLID